MLVAFTVSFLLVSGIQAQDYYAPVEGSLIDLKKKNDSNLAISTFFGSKPDKGLTAQMSFSPFNSVGIQSGFSFLTIDDGPRASSTLELINASVGFYFFKKRRQPAAKNQNQRGVLYGLYIGHALGNVETSYINAAISKMEFSKTFLQGGVLFQGTNKSLNIALKAGLLDFKTAIVDGNGSEFIPAISNIVLYDTYEFAETTVKLSFGPKAFNVYFSTTWMNATFLRKVNFLKSSASIGLRLNIQHLHSKIKESKL